MFAAGNGGNKGNSNSGSFAASIFTIPVGSVGGRNVAYYTSYGTNILTAGYGGDVTDRLVVSFVE